MTWTTDAWVLHAGYESPPAATVGEELRREPFELADLAPGEALVEPVLGSWEANLEHALRRSPIDVCSTRGERVVLLGNFGVVQVVRVEPGGPDGLAGQEVREGDLCLLLAFGPTDRHGYAELVYAYDAPNTFGLLARRTKIPARLLLPLPAATRHSLAQWAAYGRYFTAWDNWRCAVGCWRVQVPDDDPADHLVIGWGGGVSLALLTLARRQGFRVAMTASSDTRLALLDRLGITPIDRREFPGLASAGPGGADRDQARRHRQSLADLRRRVDEPSDGRGVSVFADNIGQPLFEATRAVLARQGVITTCGWKAGMRLNYLRGAECIDRHLFVHTHVWRYQDSARIRDDIEETGWLPDEADTVVYGFDEVPELATAYSDGRVDSYFPLYRVA